MHVITVSVISRQPLNTLTYFTRLPVSRGDVVSAVIRGKNIPAVVLESLPASMAKTDIRKGEFGLLKVSEKLGTLSEEMVSIGEKISQMYICSPGEAIYHLFGEHPWLYKQHVQKEGRISAIEAPLKERVKLYEKEKGNYTLILCPTHAHAERIHTHFPEAVLYTSLSPKKKQLYKPQDEQILIGTYSILSFLPRADLLIIDGDGDQWTQQERPFIDMNIAAKIAAETFGIQTIIGDHLLSPHSTAQNFPISSTHTYKAEIYNHVHERDVPWTPFLPYIQGVLKTLFDQNGSAVLYVGRKYYGGQITCRDCKHVYTCPNCEKPLAFTKQGDEPKMVCSSCKEEVPPATTCPHCGSWNLDTFGIGIERVVEEIHKLFPEVYVGVIAKNVTKTPKQIKKALETFHSFNGPKALCVTELALDSLDTLFTQAIIVSADSPLSVAEYSVSHRVAHTAIQLALLSQSPLIVQTKFPKLPLWKDISSPQTFRNTDAAERKSLGFPPYAIEIHNTKTKQQKFFNPTTFSSQESIFEALQTLRTQKRKAKDIFRVRWQ